MGTDKRKGSEGKKEGAVTVSLCTALKCKEKSVSFDFCREHYEQFKFGLIRKSGEPVPDYEKKHNHYVAYQQRRAARKVA